MSASQAARDDLTHLNVPINAALHEQMRRHKTELLGDDATWQDYFERVSRPHLPSQKPLNVEADGSPPMPFKAMISRRVFEQMQDYKNKIGVSSWQEYLDKTSSDPEGLIDLDILSVQIRAGPSPYKYDMTTNAFVPANTRVKESLPFALTLDFLTFRAGDFVYLIKGEKPKRFELVQKFGSKQVLKQ